MSHRVALLLFLFPGNDNQAPSRTENVPRGVAKDNPLGRSTGSRTRRSNTMTIERLSSRQVYRNRWMTVREDSIRRQDGSTGMSAYALPRMHRRLEG
jgi:hypothetical protein